VPDHGVRRDFDTLALICEAFDCQPGDIFEYREAAGDPVPLRATA
jgi:DNA-binding Xre family transcriptional regulator